MPLETFFQGFHDERYQKQIDPLKSTFFTNSSSSCLVKMKEVMDEDAQGFSCLQGWCVHPKTRVGK